MENLKEIEDALGILEKVKTIKDLYSVLSGV